MNKREYCAMYFVQLAADSMVTDYVQGLPGPMGADRAIARVRKAMKHFGVELADEEANEAAANKIVLATANAALEAFKHIDPGR